MKATERLAQVALFIGRLLRTCLAAFGLSMFVYIAYNYYCTYLLVKATSLCIAPQEER